MHLFRRECAVTRVSLSVDSGLGKSMSIFEWPSECNTISIGNPAWQPLTKDAVQTSINNLNVFKSFQLMPAPPSTLLPNAVSDVRSHKRT